VRRSRVDIFTIQVMTANEMEVKISFKYNYGV
jgi:hypothetical protein